jgi:hypothetical protein
MSAIFQRPLCQMGAAYDFAFRPTVGDPETGSGGPCDDRPHPVDLVSAASDPASSFAVRRSFSLCPEHEQQLRLQDAKLVRSGAPSRFAPAVRPASSGAGKG